MTFTLLTLFPDIFRGFINQSILGRSIAQGLVKVNIINIRDFTSDKRRTVDDTPYGGGAGMVMKVDVLLRTLESIKPKPYTILLSASGSKYNQKKAVLLAKKTDVAIICGHYEGVDARVEDFVNEVIAIGDFVLTGGEVAAMAVVDSVARLIPGVIKPESVSHESFSSNLLEHPQFTRPEEFRNKKVPQVLISGNHQEIKKWRKEQAVKRTKKYRPGLLERRK